MDDYMELGSIVPLEGGWYMDKETNRKFRMDEDGKAVGEDGNTVDDDDEDGYR